MIPSWASLGSYAPFCAVLVAVAASQSNPGPDVSPPTKSRYSLSPPSSQDSHWPGPGAAPPHPNAGSDSPHSLQVSSAPVPPPRFIPPPSPSPVPFPVPHLEHQPAHAEHHAQQVHVVRRGVLQRRVALGGGRLVPAGGAVSEAGGEGRAQTRTPLGAPPSSPCNPRGPPRVRHCGWSALTSGAATGSAQL